LRRIARLTSTWGLTLTAIVEVDPAPCPGWRVMYPQVGVVQSPLAHRVEHGNSNRLTGCQAGPWFAVTRAVDRGVIATANELFEARHYPGVVAMCSDALDDEPECVPLLLIRARARMALRRDLDAQADLRDIIRLDPRCSLGYRLLGELAARRNENASAAVFFREALRLDPDDREAHDWLQIVTAPSRPAAAATPPPAPAAAAGHFSPRPRPSSPSQARLARGTQPPDQSGRVARADPEERPTQPLGSTADQRRIRSQAATPPVRP